jgi:hypothetical protein
MATIEEACTAIKSRLVLIGTAKDADIYSSIRSAIKLLQRKRYWFLRKTSDVTLSVGADSVSVPTDFAMMESADLVYSGRRYSDKQGFILLEYTKLKDKYFSTGSAANGQPSACALVNTTLWLSHLAEVAGTLKFTYYCKDIALPTAASDTSVWLGDDGYDAVVSLAQYIYEKEYLQRPDADPSSALGYQTRLDENHTFYERGAY